MPPVLARMPVKVIPVEVVQPVDTIISVESRVLEFPSGALEKVI